MANQLTNLVDKYFDQIEIEETLKTPSHYSEIDVAQISLIIPKGMLKEYAKLIRVRKKFGKFLEEVPVFFLEDTDLLNKLHDSNKKPKHEYVNSYDVLIKLKTYVAEYEDLESEKIRLTVTELPENYAES